MISNSNEVVPAAEAGVFLGVYLGLLSGVIVKMRVYPGLLTSLCSSAAERQII